MLVKWCDMTVIISFIHTHKAATILFDCPGSKLCMFYLEFQLLQNDPTICDNIVIWAPLRFLSLCSYSLSNVSCLRVDDISFPNMSAVANAYDVKISAESCLYIEGWE
uniref:Putative ovule protein n=1 Tax=Solanum chacoense TaxID=4108 RepID=A0A0V0GN68_SOLCH